MNRNQNSFDKKSSPSGVGKQPHSWSSISLAALTMLTLTSCGSHSQSSSDAGGEKIKNSKTVDSDETDKEKEAQKEPSLAVVKVASLRLDHPIDLPGELRAYQDVAIHAKVEGFISWIGVDRGSIVHKGEKMITISCPELEEKLREAEAKVSAAVSAYKRSQAAVEAQQANLVEIKAKMEADKLTLSRLQQAGQTPGAIAQNEIDVQQKTVEADQAKSVSIENEVKAAQAVAAAELSNVQAAKNVVKSQQDMKAYLTVTSPFDGVITERNVHQGSIVAIDPSREALPLVRLQERDLLRLVVAVPESCVSGLKLNQEIQFTVPAYIGRTFTAKVARLGYALDQQTRTMPVELNAWNKTNELEPGMFATVHWNVTRPYDTLFVPSSAVASDLKGTFVNLVQGDTVKRLVVERGQTMNNMVEVVGNLKAGDTVVLKASDDLKTGTRMLAHAASQSDIEKASHEQSASGE